MIFSQVKQAVPAADVLVRFLGRPQAHKFLCPFHDSKNPSLSAKDGGIRCWSCSWSGDIFKFVQETQGVSIGDALRICAEIGGVILPDRTLRDGGGRRLPSLARNYAGILREIAAIDKDSFYEAQKAAGLAWRTAWNAKETGKVWDLVAVGAALDREVAVMEMGEPDERQ